jgi:hypothetical protein
MSLSLLWFLFICNTSMTTIMLDKSSILGVKCQKWFMYGDEIMYQYVGEEDICVDVWWTLPRGNAQMQ